MSCPNCKDKRLERSKDWFLVSEGVSIGPVDVCPFCSFDLRRFELMGDVTVDARLDIIRDYLKNAPC